MAQSLGGIAVTTGDGDIKLQRLVNIVEEMAIAARVRKPQVFVLPDETGINAFAAGHSPDEAVVAVTQGALDAFDREQLQAVIGHEFSHILNGDMKINMRLTTWIFGLCVITDFARHIMNKRGGGKAAGRLKLIAFGVFVAGSAGALAGRLLQAAVSRRREHLADASAVQFTRNPQALQSAFVVMAAQRFRNASRSRSCPGRSAHVLCRQQPGMGEQVRRFMVRDPSAARRTRARDRFARDTTQVPLACQRREAQERVAHRRGSGGSRGCRSNSRCCGAPGFDRLRSLGCIAVRTGRSRGPGRPGRGRRRVIQQGGRGISHRQDRQRPALDSRKADPRRDHAVRGAHDRGPDSAARCVAEPAGTGSAGGDQQLRRARRRIQHRGAGHVRRHHARLRSPRSGVRSSRASRRCSASNC